VALKNFKGAVPFDHCVIDDFFSVEVAAELEREFPDYENSRWFCYKNPLEDKKALNDWSAFPPLTYAVFSELVSNQVTEILAQSLAIPIYRDPGLHGGGWHIHGPGGNLNPHLDYSIHPKLGLQRKLNIIIYLSSSLEEAHGGHLGMWDHNPVDRAPGVLRTEVQPCFNRAVLFDTTQNSWHGMCRPLLQPEGIYRKSLAAYYLTDPPEGVDRRQRALYAPREDQKSDENVKRIIEKRADPQEYGSVYRT
jgi:hypothetical protein